MSPQKKNKSPDVCTSCAHISNTFESVVFFFLLYFIVRFCVFFFENPFFSFGEVLREKGGGKKGSCCEDIIKRRDHW